MSVHIETTGPAPLDPRAEQSMVPMGDGARLATDVYLPPHPGRHPAVLVRLPYDKCGRYTFMPFLAPHFTERGYAFVVQDVRGKFRSEGETMPYVHEVADGYDTLEWVSTRSWSNGAVGMFGDSYYGFTQWAALASGHQALAAIVPRVTSAELGSVRLGNSWYDGVQPLYAADYVVHYWWDKEIHEFPVDWDHRPLASVYDEAFAERGSRAAPFDVLLRQARQRRDFTPYRGVHPFAGRRIPVLHSVGWFDNLLPNSMFDYTTLRGTPDRSALQYLVADSTDHENYELSQVPVEEADDHDLSEDALARMMPAYLGPALDFFDVHLARREDASKLSPVRWHLGHDGWHDSPTWPPTAAVERRLFLTAAGALSWRPDKARLEHEWVHDPAHLVPSSVENPFAFLYEYPDEAAWGDRGDVVTFTSDAIDRPLDLTGPASLSVPVQTSGPSMHVFVKLLDVEPDGSAHMLGRGQVAVDAAPAAAGFTQARVNLSHLGYRLRPGHRLGLHVASSDFPLYLWHPGTAENPWFAARGVRNRQRLLAGGNDSYLDLTVQEG